MAELESGSPPVRVRAAEALGFLRARKAEAALVSRLRDPSPFVRQQAAMALGWCGGRKAMPPLLAALDDEDWLTRQAAHVALTNLTGMEFPFDALMAPEKRAAQAKAWRQWWAAAPADRPPADVVRLLTPLAGDDSGDHAAWRRQRGLRALGTLGGAGATEAVIKFLGPDPGPVSLIPRRRTGRITPATLAGERRRQVVCEGIRALGRLRDEAGFEYLVRLLQSRDWARYAAAALGEAGDPRAAGELLRAYIRHCKSLDGKQPRRVPRDDRMGFPKEDRMLETPYEIALAVCRLPPGSDEDLALLRRTAPWIMANLPGDHDTMMLYEPEVGHQVTRHLLEVSGLRQEACEQAFLALGRPRRAAKPRGELKWPRHAPPRMASWLPAVCIEKEDVPRLVSLLGHTDGWVRLNVAKTLAWLGDRRAIRPIAELLAAAKAEADFGYNGTFKDEEYNDAAPRWREGLIRALGILGAHEHTDLIVRILNDERSVLEVRHAAAAAHAALRDAAVRHSFGSVRRVARDALHVRGIDLSHEPRGDAGHQRPPVGRPRGSKLQAIVFIKGDNNIPNTIGTVEQADRWRQTYVVTDSGPVYRPGRTLCVLRPPRAGGKVTPLTRFADGYVGEPELSFDARHVIFTRRGQKDPWWHIWRVNLDGSGLLQLTRGPYHDVGPVYLADGRIAFASSRDGIRDEYHGYPCTALQVMNADGTGMWPIATTIGRDNEPALLHDGRLAFSRLETFYSRNKTELTLHAAHPDGTQDVVLYGPERRMFWWKLDHGPETPADDQEVGLTHRVLRMTQPQPMPDGRRIVVVTQGGLALVGPRRGGETIITPDNKKRSYTTPFPLPDGRLLCASTLKLADRKKVDLGLYVFDPVTRKLDLVYNDPATADFEPRPVVARPPPPVLSEKSRPHRYAGRFLCSSVFNTQEPEVVRRGRLVRLIEGIPAAGRHSTHTNANPVWQNHGGTLARVLGTLPLAADGSFFVEVPADRLLHFQVLDADRRVVGNQLTWIYPRPGETKGCAGCHENPNTTPRNAQPQAIRHPPVKLLPSGEEFRYRAKTWFKGSLPMVIEERTRTVRAVNLLAR